MADMDVFIGVSVRRGHFEAKVKTRLKVYVDIVLVGIIQTSMAETI